MTCASPFFKIMWGIKIKIKAISTLKKLFIHDIKTDLLKSTAINYGWKTMLKRSAFFFRKSACMSYILNAGSISFFKDKSLRVWLRCFLWVFSRFRGIRYKSKYIFPFLELQEKLRLFRVCRTKLKAKTIFKRKRQSFLLEIWCKITSCLVIQNLKQSF